MAIAVAEALMGLEKMDNTTYDINLLRNIILGSQHLLQRSTDSIESIVSDICGLQYDPNPMIYLNQYIMLWNRKKDFRAEELDVVAYKEFKVVETWTFKRNMFFVPSQEYSLYRHATKGIVRWGESDEMWLEKGDNPEVQAAERELKEKLSGYEGLTLNQIWEELGLSDEWHKYRREHDRSYNLPIFRAFYRMCRRGDLLTCGRNPGTFREPVYLLKEKAGFSDWRKDPIEEKQAIKWVVEKLIASFGITDPVHISHISGFKTAEVLPVFEELEGEGKIGKLPYKIGRKYYYIHSSKLPILYGEAPILKGNLQLSEGSLPLSNDTLLHLDGNLPLSNGSSSLPNGNLSIPNGEDGNLPPMDSVISGNSYEVRLISPMDTIVRDKSWLETFFDYSFTFEYFKKKGMKWPLSILVGNQFVGYMDCRMDWKTNKFIVKERNIFKQEFRNWKGIDLAVEELAKFHGAKEVVLMEAKCEQ